MPAIEGILFDDEAHKLASRMISELKSSGDAAVYGLPKMGQVRLAHHGPDINHKKGRGVFLILIPTVTGVTVTQHRENSGSGRASLTSANFEELLKSANARRAIVRDRLKGSVKVAPDKPGTVPGGQFESKRSKH